MRILHILFTLIWYAVFICTASAIDTSQEEQTCAELGFTPKTEAFGNCVLKLIGKRRELSESTDGRVPSYREREIQRLLEDATRRLDEYDRDRYVNRARQLRAEEAAEQRREIEILLERERSTGQLIRENNRAICRSWGDMYCD